MEFHVDYAYTDSLECLSCHKTISSGTVKIRSFLDKKQVINFFKFKNVFYIPLIFYFKKILTWYHAQCSIENHSIDLHEINGINDIRWVDIELIKKSI